MTAPTTIDWSKIKAMTFDIYGTLIDWDPGLVRAMRATTIGPHITLSDKDLLHALEAIHARLEREKPRKRKSEINAEALELYADELRLVEEGKLTREEVREAGREFGGAIGGFEAFGDTVCFPLSCQVLFVKIILLLISSPFQVDAIRRLSKYFTLVPLTNMDHVSYNATLSGPLAGCSFTASHIAEDIGSYKPDLANFHYLLDHLRADYGIEKDDVCHVAQSLFHDHEPAKKMGLRSVWVDRYGILQEMGREWEDVRGEFGMVGRVGSLGELADLVEGELK
ncbi:hypothetical protein Q7P37_004212 [Cladosporium fusiforme]